MNTLFSANTIFKRNQEIIFTYLDKELLLLDEHSGKYYSFNKVGSYIWELLSTPKTYQQIIDELMNKFEVDPLQCEHDTQKFLQSLLDKKMIEIIES